ncbi:MAG TPA: HAMP domain-containing sensor histidine kinase [Candidatus Acidoferrales bacterium]|nr:HAMP domain-containing sensor histidine kinase [Candidatus Acidoferrales bacterium]
MAHFRLRTQLVISSLLIICTLTGAILFIVRHTVQAGVAREVRGGTEASLRAFANVQRQRELELSRTAAMLAELPTLKALMTSEDPLTIQDGSQPFWKLAGSDLLLLADPGGRVLGFHVARPGWSSRLVESDLGHSLSRGEEAAWWYADGQLYWVFLRPISAGVGSDLKPLGVVAVGYQVDSSVAEQLALVAGSQIALTMGDKVIASTLSADDEDQFASWIATPRAPPEVDAQPIALGAHSYQLASVSLRKSAQAPVLCYVLMPLERTNMFLQGLNRTIFVLAVSAVIFAALLLSFVSYRITRPLEDLVAGVRALASGDYAYAITPRGSTEVAELGNAFAKMRADLLESQRRRLAAERTAALGRAAGSLSHDLRHYLATVVANAEFLYESEKLKLDRDEIYGEIQAASAQMTDLLDSLRELSREGPAISPSPGALDYCIRRAVESVLARPELRDCSIDITTSGEMTGTFDVKKMERVFFNLLLNACEASTPSQCRIRVDVRSLAESFEVRVTDNGMGVPASIRESLFDPFVSAGKPNGTGMGLAIVNKIVEDHGGSVLLEHSSPSGSTFLVRLPRSLPVAADPPAGVPETQGTSPRSH